MIKLKNITVKLQEKLMLKYCPGYLQRMPLDIEDNDEMYTVLILKFNFQTEQVIQRRRYKGLINAYKKARWLALMADWKTVDTCGVAYQIHIDEAD